jgi:hypothetical protein
MIDGWMPSVGSSSISSRGRMASARPIASCCLSSDRRPAPVQHPLRTGNISKMKRAAWRLASASPDHLQIFHDRQPRKNIAPLRHVADPNAARA